MMHASGHLRYYTLSKSKSCDSLLVTVTWLRALNTSDVFLYFAFDEISSLEYTYDDIDYGKMNKFLF